jgi:hypothetical protein
MGSRKYGRAVLGIDQETKSNVQLIVSHTPTYNRNERNAVIQRNLRPKVHPYYTDADMENTAIGIESVVKSTSGYPEFSRSCQLAMEISNEKRRENSWGEFSQHLIFDAVK